MALTGPRTGVGSPDGAAGAEPARPAGELRSLADDLPLIVWQHDASTKQDWVNEAFCRFFGVTREEMTGRRWMELTHPDDQEGYAAAFAVAVEARAPFHREVRVRRADGAWRWMESWAEPRFAEDQTFLGHVGTSADITERKEAEAALQAAADRLHAQAELLAELLRDLQQRPTVTEQVQRLAELLVPTVGDYASVEAPDREDYVLGLAHKDPEQAEVLRELRIRHRVSADTPGSVARAAAGEPQLISPITPEVIDAAGLDPTARSALLRLAPRSHVAVPLDLGGGLRGALMVGITDPSRPLFTDDDLRFLADTAQRVGVILAAARLRQEEHDVSVRLQQALLPDELLWHPNMVVEARYQAAGALLEVGGDWYDTFVWPDGRIGVMVGDVVGHNLDSVAAMGRLRAATAALAAGTDPSPSALMDALERFARGRDGTDFATAACVVLDPSTGELTWTSAGHPPVVVLAPGGDPVRLTGAQTAPLAAGPPVTREDGRVLLDPGTLVVLYSDGLVERRRERLDVGLGRLDETLDALRDEPIADVAEQLITRLTAGLAPHDDIVVACFRWTPPIAARRLVLTASEEQLAVLRQDLRAWLVEQAVVGRRQGDILLGVGEACTNAIEHAYPQQPRGRIEVDLADHGHHLSVTVRDRGSWRPAGQHSRYGGRGTSIMQQVSDRYLRVTSDEGTSVTMTFDRRPAGGEQP